MTLRAKADIHWGAFCIGMLGTLLTLAALLTGCRTVTVNVPPGSTNVTVIVNQSYQPSFDLPVGDSAIKAAVTAAKTP